MTATVPVNGAALRERLLTAGLSDRTYAERSGLGDAAVRGMLIRNEVNGSISIADLRRAATEARMTMGDLFDRTATDEPDDTPSDDVAVLAQVLNSQRLMHPEDRLAQALGWHIDRLREAITALDAHLNTVGLLVHRNSMGVCIRANDKRAKHAIDRLITYKDADDGIGQGTGRVLYAAYQGTLSPTDTSVDRMMQLGALANRGAISVSSGIGTRVQLTDDTAYCFDMSR